MTEAEATEATIQLDLQELLCEMGGRGAPPDVHAHPSEPVTGNVTAFGARRPRGPNRLVAPAAKPRLPVALIFACLVVVYVGIRYYLAEATAQGPLAGGTYWPDDAVRHNVSGSPANRASASAP